MLAIWDFRLGAESTLTILSGHERAVYLYCDHNHSLQQIEAFLLECGVADVQIETFLERLVGHRLMIKLDGRYLSLAVAAADIISDKGRPGTRSRTAEHVVL